MGTRSITHFRKSATGRSNARMRAPPPFLQFRTVPARRIATNSSRNLKRLPRAYQKDSSRRSTILRARSPPHGGTEQTWNQPGDGLPSDHPLVGRAGQRVRPLASGLTRAFGGWRRALGAWAKRGVARNIIQESGSGNPDVQSVRRHPRSTRMANTRRAGGRTDLVTRPP